MTEDEFDVDASIAAGWARFADHLAGLVRDLGDGGTFDIAVPRPGSPDSDSPYVRVTALPGDRRQAEVSGGDAPDEAPGPAGSLGDVLAGLGWDPGTAVDGRIVVPAADADRLAGTVADTLVRVFGVPHPAFLHDATGPVTGEPEPPGETPDHPDFRPVPVSCPDDATRAVGTALAEVYSTDVPADERDVFTVPAGGVLLFVRAHQSLPLVLFRSPLVTAIGDPDAARQEILSLNRESLWCRYVFDGETITAESELVDRVFVPVNFKIQLAEIAAELRDVTGDLARRVGGQRWSDLRAAD